MSSALSESIGGDKGGCQAKVTGSLLFRLPDACARLGQADVGQDAADELAGEFGRVRGFQVERGNDGENGCAGFGGQRHVAQVDAVKRRFTRAEDEWAALF